MATLNVSLPDSMKKWVDDQAEKRGFVDASDYVRDLIHRDQAQKDKLIESLERGAASGISDRTVSDIWEAAQRSLKRD